MREIAASGVLLVIVAGATARPGAAQEAGATMQEQLADEVFNGCNTELARFCAEVTPGQQRLLGCLYAYGDKLTTRCEYALYHAAARLQRAAGAITYVASECRAELETHCAEVASAKAAWRSA